MSFFRQKTIGEQIIDFFPERLPLLFLLIVVIALPVTFYLATHQTQYQQKAASATADISVDFGNRQSTKYPISQTFLGVGGLGLQNVTGVAPNYLSQANFHLTRIDTNFQNIFPTADSASNPTQQNWATLDSALSFFQANKLTPVLIMDYSPSWLQPQNQNPSLPNPCQPIGKPLDHVKPTYIVNGQDQGSQMFGQLAAQLVSHMDQKFPSLHPFYELWNEPSGTSFLCETANDPSPDATRLYQWKSLYAAVAPLMKQQAQKDGMQVRIGGPALSYSQVYAATWIPSIVQDATVAPYIDFISYHHYEEGSSIWPDLVSETQGVNTRGHIYLYQDIASYVRSGKQPNPQQTPIILDEYNASSCNPVQCRNDVTYSPLWNALFLTDMLDAVITPVSPNGVAQNVIAGVTYFTWSNPTGGFCLFGALDTTMDCSLNGTLMPYPQYYAYALFGGSNYLNIEDNGYVANSLSSNTAGVYVTGFYTSKLDNIIIVNTSGNDYPALSILAQNPGYQVPSQASVYTLSYTKNPQAPITTQQVTVGQQQNGALVAVHVPQYTVVAVSVQASSVADVPTATPTPTSLPGPTFLPPNTPTPTPLPTRIPSPYQSNDLLIYTTTLMNGFRDNSFGFSQKNSCNTLSFIIPPCSFSIAYTGWGAIDFLAPKDEGHLDTSQYKSINWDVNTGGLPLSDFSVLFTGPGVNNEYQLAPANVVRVFPGGWVEVSVPLSLINPRNRPMDTLQLKNWLNQQLPIIFVQNVRLVHN